MMTLLCHDSPSLNIDTLGASQRQLQSRQHYVKRERESISTTEDVEVAETMLAKMLRLKTLAKENYQRMSFWMI